MPLTSCKNKCGFVAVIGRPSTGKSTLVNKLCGGKVSIVSPVPQTTRNSIRGIANRKDCQLIFMDTPGYHNSERKINLRLQAIARERLSEADCVLYVIDCTRNAGKEEAAVASLAAPFSERAAIALNKTDLPSANPDKTRLFAAETLPLVPAERVLEISARTGKGTASLFAVLSALVPEGEPLYPNDFYTDQEVDFRIAEIIREKAILNTSKEIPHSVHVKISDMQARRGGKELFVRAFLVAERESQKAILIGKNASMIKKIKEDCASDFRKIFPFFIILDLQVRVSKNWRQQDSIIKGLR